MSQPTAFEKLRQRKAEEDRIANEKAERVRNERRAEEKAFFDKICEALKPYMDCTLTDDYGTQRKVSVAIFEKDLRAGVCFDGHQFLTFQPKRHWSSCHCEGPCDHTGNTWLTMSALQHRPKDKDYYCWFGCDVRTEDENSFAEAMNRMLSEFRYSGWVK